MEEKINGGDQSRSLLPTLPGNKENDGDDNDDNGDDDGDDNGYDDDDNDDDAVAHIFVFVPDGKGCEREASPVLQLHLQY